MNPAHAADVSTARPTSDGGLIPVLGISRIARMATGLQLIGAPCSAGAHHAGLELAPDALRRAGLMDRLRRVERTVTDVGDLPGRIFTADPEHPDARNREQVLFACRDVAAAVRRAHTSGQIPVVLGGDCSITVGVVAGCLADYPGELGLLYLDGDADLRTPQTTTAGNFDGMVIAALLGEGDPAYTSLAGSAPMLTPDRMAILGYDDTDIDPRERHLLDPPLHHTTGERLASDPRRFATAARAHVESASSAIVIHFDVDAVDSADLPLANYPHHGKGVPLDTAITVLRILCASSQLAAVVLTEVNPTHDPTGEQLRRYIHGVASALNGNVG